MKDVIPILEFLSSANNGILFFILAIAVTALAGFCIYVVDKHVGRDK